MANFKSFKAKTYFAFGAIVFISLILLLTVFRLFSILEGLESYVTNVTELKEHVQNAKENESNMFSFDTRSASFINDGASVYADNIDSLQISMVNEIEALLEHDLTTDYELDNEFTALSDAFQQYYSLIEEVKDKIQTRGFGKHKLAGELSAQVSSLSVKSSMSAFDIQVDEISQQIYDFQIAESAEGAAALEGTLNELIKMY